MEYHRRIGLGLLPHPRESSQARASCRHSLGHQGSGALRLHKGKAQFRRAKLLPNQGDARQQMRPQCPNKLIRISYDFSFWSRAVFRGNNHTPYGFELFSFSWHPSVNVGIRHILKHSANIGFVSANGSNDLL